MVRNGLIILVGFALMAGAYWVGSITRVSSASQIAPTSVQMTTHVKATSTELSAKTTSIQLSTSVSIQSKAQQLIQSTSSGMVCKEVASKAVMLENETTPGWQMTLIRSHFNQNAGKCYYETQAVQTAHPLNRVDTIRVAPDDQSVAFCMYQDGQSQPFICNGANGTITETQYHTLATELFTL